VGGMVKGGTSNDASQNHHSVQEVVAIEYTCRLVKYYCFSRDWRDRCVDDTLTIDHAKRNSIG
jgi:hypothetical protein